MPARMLYARYVLVLTSLISDIPRYRIPGSADHSVHYRSTVMQTCTYNNSKRAHGGRQFVNRLLFWERARYKGMAQPWDKGHARGKMEAVVIERLFKGFQLSWG